MARKVKAEVVLKGLVIDAVEQVVGDVIEVSKGLLERSLKLAPVGTLKSLNKCEMSAAEKALDERDKALDDRAAELDERAGELATQSELIDTAASALTAREEAVTTAEAALKAKAPE